MKIIPDNISIITCKEASRFLEPCPFCGSAAHIGIYSYGSGNYGSGDELRVVCSNRDCGVTMVGKDVSWRSEEHCGCEIKSTVSKWNRRIYNETLDR